MCMALASVLLGWLNLDAESAGYVWGTALPRVLPTTLILAVVVPALAGVLGVAAAWLVAVHEFPGRRLLEALLIVPLAIPAYLLATVYIGWLDYAGPIQTLLRAWFGQGAALPPIRSTGGAAITLALALYPYVYLLARGAFATQGQRALEVGQSLGMSRWQGFWRVGLPLARPWIAGGLLLVMMETLADFGAVAAFNVDTLTVSIYQAWFALFSLPTALSLASVLVLVAAVVAAAERRTRRQRGYTAAGQQARRVHLRGAGAWGATVALGTLATVAALAPITQLLVWAAQHASDFDTRYWAFASHSLSLSAMAVGLLLAGALALAGLQNRAGRAGHLLARIAQSGYAVPGAVLAVALFTPLAGLSNAFNAATPADWAPILLHTSLATVLLAYATRFMTVASQPIEAGQLRITPALRDAARSLGLQGSRLWATVHLPLLRPAILGAALLVFIDVMKELPMTLMTRPYGWDTLAVRVFEMTAEGEWERAAVPGIGIVLLGLLPVAWLMRSSDPSGATHAA